MNLNKYPASKILIIIFLVSLSIRLGFGIYTFQKTGTSKFCDDWDYISYGEQIIEQGIFVPDISKLFSNSHLVGPGFPLIIAAMFKIFGESYLPVIVLNAIVSSFICILVFYIGKEVFDRNVGLISAVWSIFYVNFIVYIPSVLKEVWLAFLFPLIIYLFILETKRNEISCKNILLPVTYAFLIHMDERFFTFFPVLIISFLFLDQVGCKLGLKKSLLFSVIVIMLMIPWLVRNYYVYNRPIILTERTARFTDKLFGYVNGKGVEKKQSPVFEWNESMIEPILNGEEVQGLKGNKYRSIQTGLQKGFIPHKYSKYERWWAEFKEFWRPFRCTGEYVGDGFRFEKPWSIKHNISEGVTHGLLLPIFLIGILYIIKFQNKYGYFLLVIICTHMIIHVFIDHARNRYRIPIDLFIIITAFYGIYQIYLKLKSKVLIESHKI